jgi:hypothetical protein
VPTLARVTYYDNSRPLIPSTFELSRKALRKMSKLPEKYLVLIYHNITTITLFVHKVKNILPISDYSFYIHIIVIGYSNGK